MIELESGPRAGGRWLLRPGESLSFGRTEMADIILQEDCLLSSKHFQVSVDHDQCMIADLKSTNGTWVDGQKVSKQTVANGDRVKAGGSVFVFQIDSRDIYQRTEQGPVDPMTASEEDSGPSEQIDATIGNDSVQKLTDLDRKAEPESTAPNVVSMPPIAPSPRWTSNTNSPAAAQASSAPTDSLPPKFEIQFVRTATGLWRGVQAETEIPPQRLVNRLAEQSPVSLIIDFARTELPLPDVKETNADCYLLSNLSVEAAAEVSPRIIRATDVEQRTTWIQQGWGADGLIVLFSNVEVDPLRQHLQQLMRVTDDGTSVSHGILGLCWPRVLSAILSDGQSKLAAEIIEPYDAILLESPDVPGSWVIFGDDRLPQLIDGCNIPCALVQVDDSAASGLANDQP